MTFKELREILPKNISNGTVEEVLKILNMAGSDVGAHQEYIEDIFRSNIDAIKGIREEESQKLFKYIRAVKFVILKQRMSVIDAYMALFKDTASKVLEKHSKEYLSAYANSYNKSKMVRQIESSLIVDFYIYYNWARHEALMKQVELMRGKAAPSEVPVMKKDRNTGRMIPARDENGDIIFEKKYMVVTPAIQQIAAKTVLEMTKPPEENQVTLKIGMTDEAVKAQKDTADALRELAQKQREALANGCSLDAIQVIGDKIAEKTLEDVEDIEIEEDE